jgi:hypothetical protein
MATAEAENTKRSWKVSQKGGAVIIEGDYADIQEIASDIADPKTELGKISRSETSILKVKGFPLSVLREAFHTHYPGSLDEHFSVQCRYEASQNGYIVVHSGQDAYKKGQFLK